MRTCASMQKDVKRFGCARKQRQECESRSPLFGNPLIAELAVSKSCTLAVSRVAWSGTIDAIDACHHISTTFPLPRCANTIAIFATPWETLQNDKGIWVLKGKVVHGFLVWVCRGILQCESVMDMQRSRLIDEEAETIGQIYINAKSCLSIGLHRQVAEQILSGRRSMSCLWSTHSFLKPSIPYGECFLRCSGLCHLDLEFHVLPSVRAVKARAIAVNEKWTERNGNTTESKDC